MEREIRSDVVVIGGGLAGLAAATMLARAGRRVQVLEQASAVGGRARTDEQEGFFFNRGPHAIYRLGEARAILQELAIPYAGQRLPAAGDGLRGEQLGPLAVNALSFLTTPFLSVAGRREMLGLIGRLRRLDPGAWDAVPLNAWLASEIRDASLRTLVATMCQVATYANDPERLSAGAALLQVQHTLLGGVEYLDGGWQTLVDGLAGAARAAGAVIRTRKPVTEVAWDGAGWQVTPASGAIIRAPGVLLAVGPRVAAGLVRGAGHRTLTAWAAAAIPVRLASLTVGLRSLPRPARRVVFSLDAPLYYSVHSAVARLAPPGGALVHVARYLGSDEDGVTMRPSLEALLDRVQPGWRAVCMAQQFLPRMTVSEALVTAANGGRAGRPGPAVPDAPGLYVAGDWVGQAGLLADAALASARQAAQALLGAVPVSQPTQGETARSVA